MITLHDLAGADPALRFSPYCWRTKFALAHKGLAFDAQPWRFTETDRIAFSGQGRVPVIQDGAQVVSDSWAIAVYLDQAYPEKPILGGPAGQAHARFINAWADSVLLPGIATLIVRDLLDVVAEKDRDYFRTSRESRFGRTLEDVQAGREDRVAAFRASLTPLRLALQGRPWLGGAQPSYADYIVAGTLMWPRCSSTFAVIAPDGPIGEWFGRVLDLHGGVGRSAKTV
jgi:glutathione S-transferase